MERMRKRFPIIALAAIMSSLGTGCEWRSSPPTIPIAAAAVLADDTFACLSEPGQTIEIKEDRGYQAYKNRFFHGGTRFQAGTSSWLTQQVPDYKTPYPINLGGGEGACWAGGIVLGTSSYEARWGQLYAKLPGDKRQNSASVVWTGAPNFTLDGIRIHNTWDAIRIGPGSANFTIKNVWVTRNRDDCVENDNMHPGVIDDSLFDGCYVALSARSSPDDDVAGGSNIWIVQNSLFRLEPMPGAHNDGPNPRQPGHKIWLKWKRGVGPRLKLYNNIFMAEQRSNVSAWLGGIPPLTQEGEPIVEIVDCKDNIMVWLGDGDYPYHLLDCFTITKDRSVWDGAKRDWIDRHPKVPRLPGDPASGAGERS